MIHSSESAGLYPSRANPSKSLLGDDNKPFPEVTEAVLREERKNPAIKAELIEGKPSDGKSDWWRQNLTTSTELQNNVHALIQRCMGLLARRRQLLNVFFGPCNSIALMTVAWDGHMGIQGLPPNPRQMSEHTLTSISPFIRPIMRPKGMDRACCP